MFNRSSQIGLLTKLDQQLRQLTAAVLHRRQQQGLTRDELVSRLLGKLVGQIQQPAHFRRHADITGRILHSR